MRSQPAPDQPAVWAAAHSFCAAQIPHLTGTNSSRRRQAPSQSSQPREQHICTSRDTELQVTLDAIALKQPNLISVKQTANTKHLISI